jgi:hypothetical protein
VKLTALSIGSSGRGFRGRLRLAVPNGGVSELPYSWLSDGTPLPSPWPGSPPKDGGQSYGDLVQIALALPQEVGNEVIFDLYRPCTEPQMDGDGLVIDDLHVE